MTLTDVSTTRAEVIHSQVDCGSSIDGINFSDYVIDLIDQRCRDVIGRFSVKS